MKKFISADTIRNNAILLARRIHEDGFIPDVIYVSLRGGAIFGNVISEYFKIIRGSDRPIFYAAVVARSYTGVNTQDAIRIDGWTYNPKYLRHGDKVLFIDDIYDTGVTVNHLVDIIESKGIPRKDIRVAVHDYKHKSYLPHEQLPDYYCNIYDIKTPEEDCWVHYLSHELVDLNKEEIEEYYSGELGIDSILNTILGRSQNPKK